MRTRERRRTAPRVIFILKCESARAWRRDLPHGDRCSRRNSLLLLRDFLRITKKARSTSQPHFVVGTPVRQLKQTRVCRPFECWQAIATLPTSTTKLMEINGNSKVPKQFTTQFFPRRGLLQMPLLKFHVSAPRVSYVLWHFIPKNIELFTEKLNQQAENSSKTALSNCRLQKVE